MSRRRSRLFLSSLVILWAIMNALAPWGHSAAAQGETILRVGTAVGTLVGGLIAAGRVDGLSRWWRLAYVASLASYLIAEVLRLTNTLGGDNRWADVVATLAFVLCPTLTLVALVLLWRCSGSAASRRWRQPALTNVLDGLVAGLSFLILAAMGDFVHQLTASSLSHAGAVVTLVLFTGELAVVGTAVVIAIVYDMDRPFRYNYLLFAGGVVAMAASYRVAVYLRFIGAEAGVAWANVGFIVGLLMIANAMLDTSETPRQAHRDRHDGRTDWVQLVLPYVGFLGLAVLFAFHVFTGRPLSLVAVCAAVVLVALVALRQVVAMRAQSQLTQRLYWALRHDTLTGLPNRILFSQLLEEATQAGEAVLILIDLDDFKDVNDRYGHAAGDEVLRAVGGRLKTCLAEGDTLARIGGDEFAVLTREGDQLAAVADRLRVALRGPFAVHGSSVRVRASIGVVGPGAPGLLQTADDLLRQADISMFAGKQQGKDTTVVYRPSTGARVDFPAALRAAKGAAPDGFRLLYQCVVGLADGRPVAFEALSRWTAPNGMQVSPETFVNAAEAAGLGATLDALVLDTACREVASVDGSIDIHVNVGAARLGNTGFDETVRETLQRYGIEPTRLVLEITETVPIVDLDDAATHIGGLSALGVRFALDDFGSGHNSLTYLHSLPIQIVKLDRSLVGGAQPERERALYRSVMNLCDDLGLTVVAEGIETDAQATMVQAAGCRFAQGNLYGRPTPIGVARGAVPTK